MSPFDVRVRNEMERAARLHPPIASHDEAFSVLAEEIDEIMREVYKNARHRDLANLRTELVQSAAMCGRWIENMKIVYETAGDEAEFLSELANECTVIEPRSEPRSDHAHLTVIRRQFRKIERRMLDGDGWLTLPDHLFELRSDLTLLALLLAEWDSQRQPRDADERPASIPMKAA